MNLQIRNVPQGIHKELKRRAKAEGQSLSEYVGRLIEERLVLPSRRDWLKQLRSDDPIDLGKPAAELLAEEREEWDRELDRKLGQRT